MFMEFSKCVLRREDKESQSPTDGVAIPRMNNQFAFLRLIRGLATPSVGQEPTINPGWNTSGSHVRLISRHQRKIPFLDLTEMWETSGTKAGGCGWAVNE